MRINTEMKKILCRLEKMDSSEFFFENLTTNEVGIRLIDIYHNCSDPCVRALISRFLECGGAVWQRKLLLADTGHIASTKERLASLDDYTDLLINEDPKLPKYSFG